MEAFEGKVETLDAIILELQNLRAEFERDKADQEKRFALLE